MPNGLAVSDVVALIDVITAKSQSAQGPANQINIINMALAVTGQGPIPVIIARLSDIITTTTTDISALSSAQPFTEKADQDAILKSFTTVLDLDSVCKKYGALTTRVKFVQVSQALFNILIGKAGLVPNLLPFVGPPLAAVLRQLESVEDTLAFEVIDLCPDVGSDIQKQKDSLDMTLGQAIDAWNGGITI